MWLLLLWLSVGALASELGLETVLAAWLTRYTPAFILERI